MATSTAPIVTKPVVEKAKRTPATLPDRIKSQLTAAALRNKLSAGDIEILEAHIGKLKALLA